MIPPMQSSDSLLESDHEIPLARTLLNSPYHTCTPRQRVSILARITLHYTTCSETERTIVVINLQNHGSHPIGGIEFQRICPNESGRMEGAGFFNDSIMAAYLALLQSSVQPKLTVASSWAALHLIAKRYDEVMRLFDTEAPDVSMDFLHLLYSRKWKGIYFHMYL